MMAVGKPRKPSNRMGKLLDSHLYDTYDIIITMISTLQVQWQHVGWYFQVYADCFHDYTPTLYYSLVPRPSFESLGTRLTPTHSCQLLSYRAKLFCMRHCKFQRPWSTILPVEANVLFMPSVTTAMGRSLVIVMAWMGSTVLLAAKDI